MRIFLLKTWRDALARKGQFGALVLLVMLGILSYVAFISGYIDLSASLERANTELKYADFTTRVISAPASAIDRVRKVPGVRYAEGALVVDTGLDLSDNEQATARVVTVPTDRTPEVNRLHLVEGRTLRGDAYGEALLHPKFAGETGLGVGDTLDLRVDGRTEPVRVVGIATAPNHLYPIREKGEIPSPGEFAIVYVSQHESERLFRRPPVITDVHVRTAPGADLDTVMDDVEDSLDSFTVLDNVARADDPSNFALNEEVEQNRVLAQSMPILILAISALSLFITLSRVVTSQRGEIGLAKALGYSDWAILAHYLAFTLLVALFGSVLGIALGILAARGIAASYVTLLGIPFLTSRIHPDVLGVSVLMSVAACVLAGIVPAWASARIAPAEAMHSDPNLAVKGGSIPIVERLFGWAMPRTFTFRIPLRNVFRARRRSAYTIIGVAFAMVLTIATVSMFDSIDYLIDKVFSQSERWDVLGAFERPFNDDRIAEVRGWDGVERVDGALTLPVTFVAASGAEHDGAVTAMAPDAQFHGFDVTAGDDASVALAAGELVMARSVADKLAVGVGDTVRVDSPYLDDDLPVRIGSIADETLGGPVYAELDVGRQLAGETRIVYNTLYLNVDPARAETIRSDLYDLPDAAQAQIKATLVEKLLELMAFSRFFGAILLAFGYAMAFAVIYNTFTANIHERTREIATMRTIGEDSGRLAIMVTIENLLLAIVGIPLGVWLGLRAADALYASFSTEAYSFTAIVFPSSVASVSATIVVVMLLSELPPIRRIFKMDLAEATKVME